MIFIRRVGHGPRKYLLDFCGNPNAFVDSGSSSIIYCWELGCILLSFSLHLFLIAWPKKIAADGSYAAVVGLPIFHTSKC